MEITYPLEVDDYWRFNQFATRRTPALARAALLRTCVLPVLFAIEFLVMHVAVWVTLPALILLTAAWVGYLRWALKRATFRMARARTGSLGLHTMRLLPEGLREQGDVVEAFVRWEKVVEVALSPHHVVLFLGPSYAFIVPTRAFPSEDEAARFFEAARGYWQSARDGSAPPLLAQSATWPPPPQRLT